MPLCKDSLFHSLTRSANMVFTSSGSSIDGLVVSVFLPDKILEQVLNHPGVGKKMFVAVIVVGHEIFARFSKRLPALQSVEIYSNRNINSGLEQAVTLQLYNWISVQKDREMTGAGHVNDEIMDSHPRDHGMTGSGQATEMTGEEDYGNDGRIDFHQKFEAIMS